MIKRQEGRYKVLCNECLSKLEDGNRRYRSYLRNARVLELSYAGHRNITVEFDYCATCAKKLGTKWFSQFNGQLQLMKKVEFKKSFLEQVFPGSKRITILTKKNRGPRRNSVVLTD